MKREEEGWSKEEREEDKLEKCRTRSRGKTNVVYGKSKRHVLIHHHENDFVILCI